MGLILPFQSAEAYFVVPGVALFFQLFKLCRGDGTQVSEHMCSVKRVGILAFVFGGNDDTRQFPYIFTQSCGIFRTEIPFEGECRKPVVSGAFGNVFCNVTLRHFDEPGECGCS